MEEAADEWWNVYKKRQQSSGSNRMIHVNNLDVVSNHYVDHLVLTVLTTETERPAKRQKGNSRTSNMEPVNTTTISPNGKMDIGSSVVDSAEDMVDSAKDMVDSEEDIVDSAEDVGDGEVNTTEVMENIAELDSADDMEDSVGDRKKSINNDKYTERDYTDNSDSEYEDNSRVNMGKMVTVERIVTMKRFTLARRRRTSMYT